MKKTQFTLLSLLVLGLLSFSACSQGQPSKPADQVIKEGVQNLGKATSYQYEGDVKADLKGQSPDAPKDIHFDFQFSGNLDFKSVQDPKLNLKADVVAKADTQDSSGSFEARLNKDAVFFNIAKFALKDDQGTTLPKEFTDKYIGKWTKISFPQGFLQQLSSQLPLNGDQNLTPEQKQLKDLVEGTNFLKDINFVGTENIHGSDSYHYHATVDKDNLNAFMLKLADLQKRNLSDDDKKTLKDDLQKYDFATDVWVAKDQSILNKIVLTVTFKGSATEPQGTVTLTGILFDFNKPMTVEVPKDAQDLPLGDLLLPGLSMGVNSTDTGIPPSDISGMTEETTSEDSGTSNSFTSEVNQHIVSP